MTSSTHWTGRNCVVLSDPRTEVRTVRLTSRLISGGRSLLRHWAFWWLLFWPWDISAVSSCLRCRKGTFVFSLRSVSTNYGIKTKWQYRESAWWVRVHAQEAVCSGRLFSSDPFDRQKRICPSLCIKEGPVMSDSGSEVMTEVSNNVG